MWWREAKVTEFYFKSTIIADYEFDNRLYKICKYLGFFLLRNGGVICFVVTQKVKELKNYYLH